MTLGIITGVAFGCWLTERLWPANDLPRVRAWYPRVVVVNLVQLGIVNNYADLPIFDMLFGTFDNARVSPPRCGFDSWREDRFEDMLVFRNVNGRGADGRPPLHFLPTCIGCSKRWACQEAREGGA